VPLPDGVVTEIVPVEAPAGTVAEICVSDVTTKEDAAVPLNETAVAPARVVPVMMTTVPPGPDVGLKLEIAGSIENEATDVPEPRDVIVIGPVVVPA
jgi:hypothetical protein